MTDSRVHRPLPLLLAVLALVVALLPTGAGADPATVAANEPPAPMAGGFSYAKYALPTCADLTYATDVFSRDDCGIGEFSTQNTPAGAKVTVRFLAPGTQTAFASQDLDAAEAADAGYAFEIAPAAAWPSGEIGVEVLVDGKPAGRSEFRHNFIGADLAVTAKQDGSPYRPGEEVPVTGTLHQLDTNQFGSQSETGVPARATLQVVDAAGNELGRVGPVTAGDNGAFTAKIPASVTNKVDAGEDTDFATTIAVRAVNAEYTDPDSGAWASLQAGSVGVEMFDPATELILDNKFVSSKGWVKPGDRYPFLVEVRNYTTSARSNLRVTIPAPPSARFLDLERLSGGGSAAINDGQITWTVPSIAAAKDGVPSQVALLVTARAATLRQDPEVVWKDLSATATLRYEGGPTLTSSTHGPKVIPPSGHDTARFGDKPFPIVPVDYADRKHQADHQGADLDRVVNDPNFEGSTFNLYQEMSYGQLFPQGTVPSADKATATYSEYDGDYTFTSYEPSTGNAPCRGTTLAPAAGTPAFDTRIVDGWYQLPGTTEYYGGDFPAFTLGLAGSIDSACGQLGKVVYDAATAADPDIDYNDYDSDRDGVVDFFMVVTVGCGGNGASQVPAEFCPYQDTNQIPYDNSWPHSSDLQMQYKDEATKQRGYISDDQLSDLSGDPQCWLDDKRAERDDCASAGGTGKNDLPVMVRVGPYNVNPETSFDSASVISHEYGHHLGLPDFYSSYSAYADMNLMAADYSQHMTVFSKQDLGWVVPEYLEPNKERTVSGWREIKRDTRSITWVRPDGRPYTLSAAAGDQNVHNGQAVGVKLPPRILIDPQVVKDGASAPHVWYSGRGNDFGCPPDGGHNLDVYLPELKDVPEGTAVEISFKSSWDIEWDWDYGFVLVSGDGENYESLESNEGYSTNNVYNPNSQQCFQEYTYGLTGQSGAYAAGEPEVTESRNPADNRYDNGAPFLADSYTTTTLAGTANPVLRFSYFTDAAFDRPGWFIDDLEVKVGDEVIYRSDFETDAERTRLFPGGCLEDTRVALICTAGWSRVNSEQPASQDHAYYLELRDQSGFDFDGHGQSDRGDTSWDPGLLIEYTDESHGYGNNGVPEPPSQHYLDSQPIPGSDCGDETDGNCADASFTDAGGDRHFSDTPSTSQPLGWMDNFSDPTREELCVSDCADPLNATYVNPWLFDFGCLDMTVQSMTGNAEGPEKLPADLSATVRLSANAGCLPFDYGGVAEVRQAEPNQACPPGQVPTGRFSDTSDNIHRDNINCIAWYTITVGATGGDAYMPGQPVSRAQMASFIARLGVEAGIVKSLDDDAPNAFSDDNGNTHEKAINILAALDLIEGKGGRKFDPKASVTRAQMATFIARLHRKAVRDVTEPTRDYFTDDNRDVHEDNINLLASLGIVQGVGGGRYAPRANVTRAQMATFIAGDLRLLVEEDVAYQGGAKVELERLTTAEGRDLPGTLVTKKRLESLTSSGCGIDNRTETVTDGTFSVRIPDSQQQGSKCTLTLAAKTSRGSGGGDRATQTVAYKFGITVR